MIDLLLQLAEVSNLDSSGTLFIQSVLGLAFLQGYTTISCCEKSCDAVNVSDSKTHKFSFLSWVFHFAHSIFHSWYIHIHGKQIWPQQRCHPVNWEMPIFFFCFFLEGGFVFNFPSNLCSIFIPRKQSCHFFLNKKLQRLKLYSTKEQFRYLWLIKLEYCLNFYWLMKVKN